MWSRVFILEVFDLFSFSLSSCIFFHFAILYFLCISVHSRKRRFWKVCLHLQLIFWIHFPFMERKNTKTTTQQHYLNYTTGIVLKQFRYNYSQWHAYCFLIHRMTFSPRNTCETTPTKTKTVNCFLLVQFSASFLSSSQLRDVFALPEDAISVYILNSTLSPDDAVKWIVFRQSILKHNCFI